jgi:hypothetical protein
MPTNVQYRPTESPGFFGSYAVIAPIGMLTVLFGLPMILALIIRFSGTVFGSKKTFFRLLQRVLLTRTLKLPRDDGIIADFQTTLSTQEMDDDERKRIAFLTVDDFGQLWEFIQSRPFRAYMWFVSGIEFTAFLTKMVETFKVVGVLYLMLDFNNLAMYVCERPTSLLLANLPQFNMVGYAPNELQSSEEYITKIVKPLLSLAATQMYGSTMGNPNNISIDGLFTEMSETYGHLNEKETYAPQSMGLYLLILIGVDFFSFLLIMAGLPKSQMAGKWVIAEHNGTKIVPAHMSWSFDVYLYSIIQLISAGMWANLEYLYAYDTTTGIRCHMPQQVWLCSRTFSLVQALIAGLFLMPTSVRFFAQRLTPVKVSFFLRHESWFEDSLDDIDEDEWDTPTVNTLESVALVESNMSWDNSLINPSLKRNVTKWRQVNSDPGHKVRHSLSDSRTGYVKAVPANGWTETQVVSTDTHVVIDTNP